jgi:UDP-N-acetylmuramoyl-L-alanyl-D-glutamate--2,6-diaminopimelate ligase
LQKSGAKYSMEPDRRKAIAFALQQATPGDIVLLAGKGHEKVQITKDGPIPFDDVDMAREILKVMGYDCESVMKAGTAGGAA